MQVSAAKAAISADSGDEGGGCVCNASGISLLEVSQYMNVIRYSLGTKCKP